MKTGSRIFLLVFATAFAFFLMPQTGAAQGRYGDWNRRYPNRDERDNRYDSRYLRDSIRRVDRESGRFKDDIDRALDRSRADGSRREDRINELAHDFHEAASQLADSFDDRRYNRSADEARRTLELGSRLDRVMSRLRLDGRAEARWRQIRQDLRTIANAYRYNY